MHEVITAIRYKLAQHIDAPNPAIREALIAQWNGIDTPDHLEDLTELIQNDEFILRYGICLRSVQRISEELLNAMYSACTPNRDLSVHHQLCKLLLEYMGEIPFVTRLLRDMQQELIDLAISALAKAIQIQSELPSLQTYDQIMKGDPAFIQEVTVPIECMTGVSLEQSTACEGHGIRAMLRKIVMTIRYYLTPKGRDRSLSTAIKLVEGSQRFALKTVERYRRYTREQVLFFENFRSETKLVNIRILERLFSEVFEPEGLHRLQASLERQDLMWMELKKGSSDSKRRFGDLAKQFLDKLSKPAQDKLIEVCAPEFLERSI